MSSFSLSLLVASFVGTIVWILQNTIKPVTQKVFSQTWHYYTGLIPVFFLLGGSEIINRLILLTRSVFPESREFSESTPMAEQVVQIAPMEQTAASGSLYLNQLSDDLLQFVNTKEFVLLATIIWSVGAIIFIAASMRSYLSFKRLILQESRVLDTVQCPVKIITSVNATTPMVIGLWKPFIVLPETQFEEKQLAMILSHELIHIKRQDLFVKLLVFTTNAIHWFNPAVYAFNKQISMFCELSCDEKVVQNMDMESRKSYGETLLSMLEYGVAQRNVVFTSSLCSSKKYMKRRLIHLMNGKKMRTPIAALSLVAAIVLVGGGGATAYAAGSVVPPKAVSPEIPTGKEPQGRGVYVQYEDGTVLFYGKDGNVTEVPEMRKSLSPQEYTTEELIESIKQAIKYNSPVSQEYIDQLQQQYLDEINETYSLELKKTKNYTTEELVALTKKGIEEGTGVPQVYVDALPQKELDAINKTYGWELEKSE